MNVGTKIYQQGAKQYNFVPISLWPSTTLSAFSISAEGGSHRLFYTKPQSKWKNEHICNPCKCSNLLLDCACYVSLVKVIFELGGFGEGVSDDLHNKSRRQRQTKIERERESVLMGAGKCVSFSYAEECKQEKIWNFAKKVNAKRKIYCGIWRDEEEKENKSVSVTDNNFWGKHVILPAEEHRLAMASVFISHFLWDRWNWCGKTKYIWASVRTT